LLQVKFTGSYLDSLPFSASPKLEVFGITRLSESSRAQSFFAETLRGQRGQHSVSWRASPPQWRSLVAKWPCSPTLPSARRGETRSAFRRPSAPLCPRGHSIPRDPWQGRVNSGEFTCQTLTLISLSAPVVIIIIAVVAVPFSFFWVFLPLPGLMSNAMGGHAGFVS
jgi:hypothetical protein